MFNNNANLIIQISQTSIMAICSLAHGPHPIAYGIKLIPLPFVSLFSSWLISVFAPGTAINIMNFGCIIYASPFILFSPKYRN